MAIKPFFSIFLLTSCNNDVVIIGGADGPTSIIVSEKSLDDMVSNALLSNNKGKYADGECIAEGHIILGSGVQHKDLIFVYTEKWSPPQSPSYLFWPYKVSKDAMQYYWL